MRKATTMGRFGRAALFVAFGIAGIAGIAGAAEDQQARPKELVQYVREARNSGVKEASIRDSAIAAGWSSATVDEAIAYVRDGQAVPAATHVAEPAASPRAATHVADPVVPPPAAAPVAGTVPAAAPPAAPEMNRDRVTDMAAAGKSRGVPDDYQIGAGDILQISVWKEPDASIPSVVVRPDGRIAMPLLKEVEVAGMTPRDAEKVITSGLSKFISGADVTVVVTAINSKKVFVMGAVKKEGPIAYSYRMTAMQAISEAGGLNDYAKRKRIYILRTSNGKNSRLPFNFDEVIKGQKMEQNIQLMPGDTLYVPH